MRALIELLPALTNLFVHFLQCSCFTLQGLELNLEEIKQKKKRESQKKSDSCTWMVSQAAHILTPSKLPSQEKKLFIQAEQECSLWCAFIVSDSPKAERCCRSLSDNPKEGSLWSFFTHLTRKHKHSRLGLSKMFFPGDFQLHGNCFYLKIQLDFTPNYQFWKICLTYQLLQKAKRFYWAIVS